LSGSGSGSGNASYIVGANTGATTRAATVTIAGVSVSFDQEILTAPTHRPIYESSNRSHEIGASFCYVTSDAGHIYTSFTQPCVWPDECSPETEGPPYHPRFSVR
jgi:hypothetical protein